MSPLVDGHLRGALPCGSFALFWSSTPPTSAVSLSRCLSLLWIYLLLIASTATHRSHAKTPTQKPVIKIGEWVEERKRRIVGSSARRFINSCRELVPPNGRLDQADATWNEWKAQGKMSDIIQRQTANTLVDTAALVNALKRGTDQEDAMADGTEPGYRVFCLSQKHTYKWFFFRVLLLYSERRSNRSSL